MGGIRTFQLLFAITSAFLWHAAQAADPAKSSSSSNSATGTAPAFPSMSNIDGQGVAAGGVGSQISGSEAGASGGSGGAFNLGVGGIVGISVGIAVVVIAIVIVWALWYLTKVRQWNIRESIRRASKRFTGRRGADEAARQSRAKKNRRTTVMVKPSAPPSDSDLEKGADAAPKPGWLADEKARSRSSSRDNRERR